MTTTELATLIGVHHELIRDAAGSLYQRTSGLFKIHQAIAIRSVLVQWGKVK
jgi:hypothetical protein